LTSEELSEAGFFLRDHHFWLLTTRSSKTAL